MINEIDALSKVAGNTEQARLAVQRELADAEADVARLSRSLAELVTEENALRIMIARRSPEPEPEPLADTAGAAQVELRLETAYNLSNWSERPRTFAVEDAVREVLDASPFASPAQVEETLRRHGRTDSREEVGSALSYLSRKGKIRNGGRARWVLFDSPQTSEDTSNEVSSDLQEAGE